ncbi:MAG TPA: chemotaxis response regulator protein-glutamate methylesterase [Polyangiaceae bacterium]|nr:chemotaxis response regulator protein-glutamate methylesterase [Polyangiaceae bacterium]
MSRIRVLVTDDSAFMRQVVTRALESDARFEVVGTAGSGADAVEQCRTLKPDVVTMDFNMPGMNGDEATRRIVAERPVPVVMLSAHTQQGAKETLQALDAGAVDFVTKPNGEVSATLGDAKAELIEKLLAAAGANVSAIAPRTVPRPPVSEPERSSPHSSSPMSSRRMSLAGSHRLIVVASSTGGPQALLRVVPYLKLSGRAALLLVQHMPDGFTAALAEQLSEAAGFPIREAEAGDLAAPGCALLAPGGSHLLLDRTGRVQLRQDPPVHGVRPAADPTLVSAAQAFGPRTIGVVLTGMGRDGAKGLAAVKASGGTTLAQDKATSLVYGMPKAAVELGVIDTVSPLDRIAAVINRWLDTDT